MSSSDSSAAGPGFESPGPSVASASSSDSEKLLHLPSFSPPPSQIELLSQPPPPSPPHDGSQTIPVNLATGSEEEDENQQLEQKKSKEMEETIEDDVNESNSNTTEKLVRKFSMSLINEDVPNDQPGFMEDDDDSLTPKDNFESLERINTQGMLAKLNSFGVINNDQDNDDASSDATVPEPEVFSQPKQVATEKSKSPTLDAIDSIDKISESREFSVECDSADPVTLRHREEQADEAINCARAPSMDSEMPSATEIDEKNSDKESLQQNIRSSGSVLTRARSSNEVAAPPISEVTPHDVLDTHPPNTAPPNADSSQNLERTSTATESLEQENDGDLSKVINSDSDIPEATDNFDELPQTQEDQGPPELDADQEENLVNCDALTGEAATPHYEQRDGDTHEGTAGVDVEIGTSADETLTNNIALSDQVEETAMTIAEEQEVVTTTPPNSQTEVDAQGNARLGQGKQTPTTMTSDRSDALLSPSLLSAQSTPPDMDIVETHLQTAQEDRSTAENVRNQDEVTPDEPAEAEKEAGIDPSNETNRSDKADPKENGASGLFLLATSDNVTDVHTKGKCRISIGSINDKDVYDDGSYLPSTQPEINDDMSVEANQEESTAQIETTKASLATSDLAAEPQGAFNDAEAGESETTIIPPPPTADIQNDNGEFVLRKRSPLPAEDGAQQNATWAESRSLHTSRGAEPPASRHDERRIYLNNLNDDENRAHDLTKDCIEWWCHVILHRAETESYEQALPLFSSLQKQLQIMKSPPRSRGRIYTRIHIVSVWQMILQLVNDSKKSPSQQSLLDVFNEIASLYEDCNRHDADEESETTKSKAKSNGSKPLQEADAISQYEKVRALVSFHKIVAKIRNGLECESFQNREDLWQYIDEFKDDLRKTVERFTPSSTARSSTCAEIVERLTGSAEKNDNTIQVADAVRQIQKRLVDTTNADSGDCDFAFSMAEFRMQCLKMLRHWHDSVLTVPTLVRLGYQEVSSPFSEPLPSSQEETILAGVGGDPAGISRRYNENDLTPMPQSRRPRNHCQLVGNTIGCDSPVVTDEGSKDVTAERERKRAAIASVLESRKGPSDIIGKQIEAPRAISQHRNIARRRDSGSYSDTRSKPPKIIIPSPKTSDRRRHRKSTSVKTSSAARRANDWPWTSTDDESSDSTIVSNELKPRAGRQLVRPTSRGYWPGRTPSIHSSYMNSRRSVSSSTWASIESTQVNKSTTNRSRVTNRFSADPASTTNRSRGFKRSRTIDDDGLFDDDTVPPANPRKRVKFTAEEEEAVIDGIKVFGKGNWAKIARSYEVLRNRTGEQIKDKARNLKNRGDIHF